MAVTAVRLGDLSKSLATMLEAIEGLRVYSFVPDNFRPPGVIVALPAIDFRDNQSGFCRATWTFPLSLIVPRNSEREAQDALSRLLSDIVVALDADPPDGIFSVEPMDALTTSISVNGQDLPAYNLRVAVRA